jgi:7-cyano-7-deazaguanine synthase in queuosine biosynthesis
VAYGQRHSVEVSHATRIAERLNASVHRVVRLDLSFLAGSALTDRSVDVPKREGDESIAGGVPVTYVPARNLLFLSLALGWAESLGGADLVVGVNAIDYSGLSGLPPGVPPSVRARGSTGHESRGQWHALARSCAACGGIESGRSSGRLWRWGCPSS